MILREIEARAHFLVLLEPVRWTAIAEPGDWLRREIAHALTHRRNVVPLLASGARMPRAADLPADLARLPSFNAVSAATSTSTRRWRSCATGSCTRPPRSRVARHGRHAAGPAAQGPSGLPPSALGQPGSLSAAASRPLLVGVSWSTVDGATSYDVEQSSTADFVRGAARPTVR